jgi:hypothetical protein
VSTTTETSVIATWLDTLLSGDAGAGGVATLATGGIHEEIDPRGNTVYPKVIYRFQGGNDLNALGAGRRVFVNALYAVYGVWQEPNYGGNLNTLAARIDTLLNGKSGVADSGIVLACVRTAPLQLASLTNGVAIRMLGGVYRIWATTS